MPKIDMASDFPFLRIKKPQPAQLNRVLTQKIRKRVARVNYMQELRDYELPDAKLEDQWEGAVAKLLAETQNQAQVPMRKGGKKTEGDGTPEMREAKAIQKDFRYGNTFLATVKEHGVAHTQRALDLQREDQVARADAMRALIEEEAKLAEQEKAQRTIERRKRWEARMLELHGEGGGSCSRIDKVTLSFRMASFSVLPVVCLCVIVEASACVSAAGSSYLVCSIPTCEHILYIYISLFSITADPNPSLYR